MHAPRQTRVSRTLVVSFDLKIFLNGSGVLGVESFSFDTTAGFDVNVDIWLISDRRLSLRRIQVQQNIHLYSRTPQALHNNLNYAQDDGNLPSEPRRRVCTSNFVVFV